MPLTTPSARPVVVRCDGSAISQHVVATATRQAACHGAPLVLLATHAPHPPRMTDPSSSLRPALVDDPKSVAERAWWRANHTDASVAVQIMTDTDLPSQRLNRLAAGARLLVLSGADVLSGGATTWGSTPHPLDRSFACPVLLAGPSVQADDHRRPAVVVGFSGSPKDAELMPPALSEAKRRGWDVVVVRAVASAGELESAMKDSWAALHTYCREIPCRVAHFVAEPAVALADQSAPGDLLVIGSRAAAPVGRLAQDSIGRETVRRARCDVLVVPLGGRSTGAAAASLDHGALALEPR